MKKIAVITATRAEYGALEPVVTELRKHEDAGFRADFIVTGTHLGELYGLTVREIAASGTRIDNGLPVPTGTKTALDISENQAETLTAFTKLFAVQRYDAVIVLGDRYEMLAVAIAAGNTLTPVFHLCGGDTTEGAIDEWIRHSITKMSYLHFVTNEVSRTRVIQLGESPDRVFNYGSLSIDNILRIADLSREDAMKSIDLPDCRYALCTYHPVTMEEADTEERMEELLSAIEAFPEIAFVVTKSNADIGGEKINAFWDQAAEHTRNLHVFASLGARRYLSLMKYADFVIGNSSSGIMEAPALHIATVNIGDRQRGRLQPESVINCEPDRESIVRAINTALSKEHRSICERVVSPYGTGNTASRIAEKVYETVMSGRIDLKKSFYDLEVPL